MLQSGASVYPVPELAGLYPMAVRRQMAARTRATTMRTCMKVPKL